MDDRNRDDLNRDGDTEMRERGIANQVKGSAKELEGKVHGAAADAVDDTSEQMKGKAKEMEGKIQKNFGKAEERMGDND